MTAVRILLISSGVAAVAWGLFLLVTTLSWAQLTALAVWLAMTVVIHDAVVAPATSAMRARWYRRADRPPAVTIVVQVGFVVGGTLTLFVAPEIWAQGRGNPNPTILAGDYAARLLGIWVVIALVVLAVTRVVTRRARR